MASKDGAVSILALSGGGLAGAFGAGALIGLSQRGERPTYKLVTGVSAGALIAPFAFLGSDWNAQLIDAFSGAHTERSVAFSRTSNFCSILESIAVRRWLHYVE